MAAGPRPIVAGLRLVAGKQLALTGVKPQGLGGMDGRKRSGGGQTPSRR